MTAVRRIVVAAAATLTGFVVVTAGAPAGASPMCVDFFAEVFDSEIANHGQHIIGDYIMGTGHDGAWPPAGQVGDVVGGRGPANAGAPGIQEHGASPGASFCNDSSSPTSPPGLD